MFHKVVGLEVPAVPRLVLEPLLHDLSPGPGFDDRVKGEGIIVNNDCLAIHVVHDEVEEAYGDGHPARDITSLRDGEVAHEGYRGHRLLEIDADGVALSAPLMPGVVWAGRERAERPSPPRAYPA